MGRSDAREPGVPRTHFVVRGETLYAIAWRYGVDYRDLAAANAIPPPYVIFPGRRLRIAAAKRTERRASPEKKRSTAPRVEPGRTAPPPPRKRARKPVPPPATRPPGRADRTAPPRAAATRPQRWRWPASGKVLSTFRQSGNKGLDISGRRGQPIQAAAEGRVVYSGGGLLGYGKLIIIKHDKRFLSAYAHNDKLLVGEGDKVIMGDKIAEMGDTGTDRVKLHFEIRRDGKPVDPEKYLPR